MFMARKPKTIKIDGIEVEEHRTSFTVAFLIALIAFSTGVLAYHYIFMVLPQKPGCVQISVKDTNAQALKGVKVGIEVYVIGETGEPVVDGFTDKTGKVIFCDKFEPDTEYHVTIIDQTGIELWNGFFATNERSTADFPIIVKE